jgi:hypothetical protein
MISMLTADLSHCTQIYYLFVDTVKHVFYVLTIFTVLCYKKQFSLSSLLTNDSFLPWKKSFICFCVARSPPMQRNGIHPDEK